MPVQIPTFKKNQSEKIKSVLPGIVFLLWMSMSGTTIYKLGYRDSETVLTAQFTSKTITIDGERESLWQLAKPYSINITTSEGDTSLFIKSKTEGTIRSLWDGASLYLLLEVNDVDISTKAEKISDRDGVEIFLDLYNDKYPKYEEDDIVLYLSASGERKTGGTDTARIGTSAVNYIYNTGGFRSGYYVESMFHIGNIKPRNGTKIGLEIVINDADSASHKTQKKIFLSSADHNGLNDNTKWGTVVLSGYDGKSPTATDYFSIQSNITKAEQLPTGIWQNEEALNRALNEAKDAMAEKDQKLINQCNIDLEKAIKNLRRSGPYPDPYDLSETKFLPDPFVLLNGNRVENAIDWDSKADEIKALAGYYEYGVLPDKPDKVTAILEDKKLLVSVEDYDKKVEFEAQLTLPGENLHLARKKFPVIVSIDFWLRPADTLFLNAGYAVLNFRYTSVAGDNAEHTGPFYELYPYDVEKGNDTGTLAAWAWGAMRCVDALEYLATQDASIDQSLDLSKIVVTGFSRCGKAALAAGLFDQRFGVVNPGASGCGGAAVYRYVSFGNTPKRNAPFGNEYPWGTSPGCEVLGDKVRHQGHNSNEMLPRFLSQDRMYRTGTFGYGERLPYDHHEIIAAIAPRAVLITTAEDDYANNAEGDAVGYEGAKPVFEFLGVPENLALNLRAAGKQNPWGFGGGHWLSIQQNRNLISFADMVFYQIPLPNDLKSAFYSNPYLTTFDKYYGGLNKMMPWRADEN